jgi:RNA polymerase sigma-70 factor (ECF subfamily)
VSRSSSDVTALLHAMHAGDQAATEEVLPLVYHELHRLAKSYMRRERPDHTLQATALVNEAYLKLVRDDVDWQSREHFIGVAANVMRRVLVDYARQHHALIRGGGLKRVEMSDHLALSVDRLDEALLIDQLLSGLGEKSARQARIVELHYFAGVPVEQIASILSIAPRTVKREWSLARIWLFQQLTLQSAPEK